VAEGVAGDRAELAAQFALRSALTAESFGAPEKMRAFEHVSGLAARIRAGVEVSLHSF
jgi:hypothetical protein